MGVDADMRGLNLASIWQIAVPGHRILILPEVNQGQYNIEVAFQFHVSSMRATLHDYLLIIMIMHIFV